MSDKYACGHTYMTGEINRTFEVSCPICYDSKQKIERLTAELEHETAEKVRIISERTTALADNERLRAALEDVMDTLDKYLGDTDPNWPSEWTDEEIKEEMPVFWSCRRAAIALNDLQHKDPDAQENEDE